MLSKVFKSRMPLLATQHQPIFMNPFRVFAAQATQPKNNLADMTISELQALGISNYQQTKIFDYA